MAGHRVNFTFFFTFCVEFNIKVSNGICTLVTGVETLNWLWLFA